MRVGCGRGADGMVARTKELPGEGSRRARTTEEGRRVEPLRTFRRQLRTAPRWAILATILVFLVVGFLADVYLIPAFSLAILYVVPTLVSALVLPPRDVRLVAILAFVGNIVDQI